MNVSSSTPFYIGLMSGTSLDGVDGVLVDFSNSMHVIAHASCPLDASLRAELLALNQMDGSNELHRAALAANALVKHYAQVVVQLLSSTGRPASEIAAIGAHGQTVRHRPQMFDGTGYTLQLNAPALLAELTGITVVADLRSRDVAAGGQGAPLVPAFHQQVFGRNDTGTLVLNIGGISNLSVLEANGGVLGFDCGPGNALMDAWCLQHTGKAYDANGAWAATGHVVEPLLQHMLAESYFQLSPPKSTGRDLFHTVWLAQQLQTVPKAAHATPADIQATLTELTAACCADAALRWGKASSELLVCGGGALNGYLMQRIAARLPAVHVGSTAERGLPPLEVEAAAFAWLARQCLQGLSGNLPAVTGAKGSRILGAIYPA